jgi:hypothetical protein
MDDLAVFINELAEGTHYGELYVNFLWPITVIQRPAITSFSGGIIRDNSHRAALSGVRKATKKTTDQSQLPKTPILNVVIRK